MEFREFINNDTTQQLTNSIINDYTNTSNLRYMDELIGNITIQLLNFKLISDDYEYNIALWTNLLCEFIPSINNYINQVITNKNGFKNSVTETIKTNIGYDGYTLENQAGSYQNNVVTSNKESLSINDIINVSKLKYQPAIIDFINEIKNQMLVVVYAG